MNYLLNEDLIERLKTLFTSGLWLLIVTCAIYLDIYRAIFPGFSMGSNIEFVDGFTFLLITGLVTSILPFIRTLILILLVGLNELLKGKLFDLLLILFDKSQDLNKNRNEYVSESDLSKFALSNNNQVASGLLKDFKRKKDNQVNLSEMRMNLFLFLTIASFIPGTFTQLLHNCSLLPMEVAKVLRFVIPFLLLYFSIKCITDSWNDDYIFVGSEIRSVIKGDRTTNDKIKSSPK